MWTLCNDSFFSFYLKIISHTKICLFPICHLFENKKCTLRLRLEAKKFFLSKKFQSHLVLLNRLTNISLGTHSHLEFL